jgi:hypothetical protein
MFADNLANIHKTHNGPEYCIPTKTTVDDHISSHNTAYKPLFQPVHEEGDEDMLVRPIDTDEVAGALKTCKGTSAPGVDGLQYRVLQQAPPCTLTALAELYTACLQSGYFPATWKAAIGVMIPKPKKDHKLVTNYRPISLLNTTGKLFEKVIARRLHNHLEYTKFWNAHQRAYLQKKEANELVYCLNEEAAAARKKGWVTTAVSLDVEKAFDAVWHDGLKYKLSQHHLPVKLIRLLSSFLDDRTIQIRVEGHLSPAVHLEAGTPQGSVLSPLLFLIFVNDLPVDPRHSCRAGQFADDITTWATAPRKRATFVRLQHVLNDIEKWCCTWRIKLNVAKTQLVTFAKRAHCPVLKLFGQQLIETTELTLLGVKMDQQLHYTNHCKEKAAAGSKQVQLLRTLSGSNWGASAQTPIRFYKQLVRPVLEYGHVATASAPKSNIDRLQRVQNAALRTALHTPWRTTTVHLHETANITTMAERLTQQKNKAISRFGDSACIQALEMQRTRML